MDRYPLYDPYCHIANVMFYSHATTVMEYAILPNGYNTHIVRSKSDAGTVIHCMVFLGLDSAVEVVEDKSRPLCGLCERMEEEYERT